MRHLNSLICSALLLACNSSSSGNEQQASETGSTTSGNGSASEGTETSSSNGACTPGATQACACTDGSDGSQTCTADGSGYGECVCESGNTGTTSDTGNATGDASASSGDAPSCGDQTCDAEETCDSCPDDCGACLPCTEAPACDGAQTPPIITTHARDLDDVALAAISPEEALSRIAATVQRGDASARLIAAALAPAESGEHRVVTMLRDVFDAHPEATQAIRRQLARAGLEKPAEYRRQHPLAAFTSQITGTSTPSHGGATPADPCANPRLRVRIAELVVGNPDDDVLGDDIYCAVVSEGAESGELKVTTPTNGLHDDGVMEYSLDEGLVWGHAGLVAPRANLVLTYNCIESDTSNNAVYSAILERIGQLAGEIASQSIPGVDAWVFPAVNAATGVLASALMLDGDDRLFNASQIIPDERFVELTTGAYWTVGRSGSHLGSDWDWSLRMEVWGCHDHGTAP